MSFKIGVDHADLDYIYNQFPKYKGVDMPDPYADPMDYSQVVTMLDGTTKGLGWLSQSWRWAFMSEAQYNILVAYAGNVNILTLTNSGTSAEYTGLLVLPEAQPEHRSGRVMDVTVTIKNLVAVV